MTSRHARKRRAHLASAAKLPQQAITVADPLVHGSSSVAAGASRAVLIAIAAVIFHAVAIGAIALASTFARARMIDHRHDVEVAVVNKKPPPPPEPPKIEEPKKEEPKKEVAKRPPIPRDPIDKPKEPPKQDEKPKEVRRIVGLNLESTTAGGTGPSFATGNTRMGETEKKAAMPEVVEPLAKSTDDKPVATANKAATRIPVAGVKFVAPVRKRAIKPNYPERARQAGVEGDVMVKVTIDATGKPTAVAVVKAADLEDLNQAAREAAMREEFSPATRDGVPVEYNLTFTYFFRLNG